MRAGLRVSARVRQLQGSGKDRVVLVFYFSGHSDGQALELGRERLSFAEVRRWMQATGAAVRLAIVDSCRSGGLIALKGGSLGPVFDIRLADHLASHGEAVITSSASSEAALESAEIRSSFFSHHMVSGLRGAADASGDGMVTLGEAYQYAFGRTVSATADTLVGPQHPLYDYRLTGRGELVLTRLHGAAGVLETPAGFDRLLLVDGSGRRWWPSWAAGGRAAWPPGRGRTRSGPGAAADVPRAGRGGGRGTARLAEEHLRESTGPAVSAKGGEELWATPLPSARGWSLALAGAWAWARATRSAAWAECGWSWRRALPGRWCSRPPRGGGPVTARPICRCEVAATNAWAVASVCWLGSRWVPVWPCRGSTRSSAAERDRRRRRRGGRRVGDAPALVLRLISDAPLVLARRERQLTPLFLPAGWLGVRF